MPAFYTIFNSIHRVWMVQIWLDMVNKEILIYFELYLNDGSFIAIFDFLPFPFSIEKEYSFILSFIQEYSISSE